MRAGAKSASDSRDAGSDETTRRRDPQAGSDSRTIFVGELAILIGRTCKEVSVARALEFADGYTCVNDVTATDLLTRHPNSAHWVRAKGFDASARSARRSSTASI